MKNILTGAIITMIFITGCVNNRHIKDELDGVEINVENTSIKEFKNGNTVIQLDSLITNKSDRHISAVTYEIEVYDKNDNLLKTYTHTYYGENKSIDKNQSVKDHFGTQYGFESKVSYFKVKLVEVRDTDEFPLIRLPLVGEYLYQSLGISEFDNIKENLPTKVHLHIDRMGAGTDYIIEDEEKIKELVNLFCEIKIYAETGEFVTDNYNYVVFTFGDVEKGLSFNRYNLELHNYMGHHIYQLENLGPFWQACAELSQ